jgi:hypothetical protein
LTLYCSLSCISAHLCPAPAVRAAAAEAHTAWLIDASRSIVQQSSAAAAPFLSRVSVLQMSRQLVVARPQSVAFCAHLGSFAVNLCTKTEKETKNSEILFQDEFSDEQCWT